MANQKMKEFLSRLYSSKQDFITQYKELCNEKTEAQKLYLYIFTELEKAVSKGNIAGLKILNNLTDYASHVEDQETLRHFYENPDNPLRSTNLIILACKHNKENILEYLFDNDSKLLQNLSVRIGRAIISPTDEDEVHHHAFYYAIRSNNTKLLNILINKWPGNYFDVREEELHNILSTTYEDLKIRNIILSDEMKIVVEGKLLDFRFFSNTFGQSQNIKDELHNIQTRIEIVLRNISSLIAEYSKTKMVDQKFLFVMKCIAQNVHILKTQMKPTYDRLPWEEIEFCLVNFVRSYTKRQESSLLCHAILDKKKILHHLHNFAMKLTEEKGTIDTSIGRKADFSSLRREKIVARIINDCPQFEELYNDYQQIIDMCSLEKISNYITLSISVDPENKDGQLVLVRILQVIGEHLKNTLESPKLSNTIRELFLLSLPTNIRETVINFCSSLSHTQLLSNMLEIEESSRVKFFIAVQDDIEKVSVVVSDIFYNYKIKMIRILLRRIINSADVDEINEIADVLNKIKLDEMVSEDFSIMEQKLEICIQELVDVITKTTNYEKELLKKIDNIISFTKDNPNKTGCNYDMGYTMLKALKGCLVYNKPVSNIEELKFYANQTLQNISSQIEPNDLKEIAELLIQLCHSVGTRNRQKNPDKVYKLMCQTFYIAQFEINNVKWTEELLEKLNENGSFFYMHKQSRVYSAIEKDYNNKLVPKISELDKTLRNKSSNKQMIEMYRSFKSDQNFRILVELYVLDIMLILNVSENYIEDNLFSLDNSTPLLMGKSLCDHLIHDNDVNDVLFSDPSIAIILNAKKFTEIDIPGIDTKIGMPIKNDSSKLKNKYYENLSTILDENKMFTALEEGNLEIVKDCLKNGVDINARDINSWNTLHFAAKGPSLEVIKFILGRSLSLNVKDINGQTLLHIAAAHGRIQNIEFFIKEVGLPLNDTDNNGKTPLHIAAQIGHNDVVEILLKNKAYTGIKDIAGFSPLHYAIKNNHIAIAKMLLETEVNVDVNEGLGSFTPLHIAAECGRLELVNLLLKNKANINARTVQKATPLHLAASHGHVNVVNVLIPKGPCVNVKNTHGCTPLYCAVKNGHDKVVDVLLKYGASVLISDQVYNNTPLHCASENGHEEIVKMLLQNEADANAANLENVTPLHLAVRGGHLEIVHLLIQHGANIHAADEKDATPLYYAVGKSHLEIAELLINYGANINEESIYKFTPLHEAISKRHNDVIDLLMIHNANVNAEDVTGNTPLHIAAAKGSTDIIDILIKNAADIHARNVSGDTPLHVAATNGQKDAVAFLLKCNAEINATNNGGLTPLCAAISGGHRDVVHLLIEHKASINVSATANSTPLCLAVEVGYKELVDCLIKNGANVNIKTTDNEVPLFSAVRNNAKEIVEMLLAYGANVNEVVDFAPLHLAAFGNYTDIVDILIKHKASVNIIGAENFTPLHIAAVKGHAEMIDTLLQYGASIDAVTTRNATPLFFAAQEGHEDIVEMLIAYGSDVNILPIANITPLHIAATTGHANIVEILLANGARTDIKTYKNRTALEQAVVHNHLEVIKVFLQCKKIDINAKGDDDWTILHLASQENNLKIVEYLVNEGSDINATTSLGLKPIHIAAKEGHRNIVEFFLNKGMSTAEPQETNQTLLHYASMSGQVEFVKYLITQGANVNTQTTDGFAALHFAAALSYKDVVEVLLQNGAFYNPVNKSHKTPLDIATNASIVHVLKSIEKLFNAVDQNNTAEVEESIKEGAYIQAKNCNNDTPLHHAAMKGCLEAANVLLQNKADPNVASYYFITPLHNAASSSHLTIVLLLLSYGAAYDAVTSNGSTPQDVATHATIKNILQLVKESFYLVKTNNYQVIDNLKQIEDINIIKAVMCARSIENKTLMATAIECKFSYVDDLNKISQGDMSVQIDTAVMLSAQGNHEAALNILKDAFDKRKEILGPDNLCTLIIRKLMSTVLYKLGAYDEALVILKEVFQKQKEILGMHDKSTLNTGGIIALVLQKQKKNEEALNVYQEMYEKQKEGLGVYHPETMIIQYKIANMLYDQGKWITALKAYKTYFEERKAIFGPDHESIRDIISKVESIYLHYKILGTKPSDILRKLQLDINTAASSGDVRTIQRLLKDGFYVNDRDIEGRTPLHYAVNSGHFSIVQFLLKNGADATIVTNKGNTPLHTATTKNYKEIVEILLQHVNREKVSEYINTKTVPAGATALHLAAKRGLFLVTKILLKYGANYSIKNVQEKTPIEFAEDHNIICLLNLVDELFKDAEQGNIQMISKLYALKPDEFIAVTNARNHSGSTLFQVTIVNGHKKLACKMLGMLKNVKC